MSWRRKPRTESPALCGDSHAALICGRFESAGGPADCTGGFPPTDSKRPQIASEYRAIETRCQSRSQRSAFPASSPGLHWLHPLARSRVGFDRRSRRSPQIGSDLDRDVRSADLHHTAVSLLHSCDSCDSWLAKRGGPRMTRMTRMEQRGRREVSHRYPRRLSQALAVHLRDLRVLRARPMRFSQSVEATGANQRRDRVSVERWKSLARRACGRQTSPQSTESSR